MSELYYGIEIGRFCFERRKKGFSYPDCCKEEICPGPEKCENPMFLSVDNTVFMDLFTHSSSEKNIEGLNWDNEYKMTKKELINNLKLEFESMLFSSNSIHVTIDRRNINKYLDWIRNSKE